LFRQRRDGHDNKKFRFSLHVRATHAATNAPTTPSLACFAASRYFVTEQSSSQPNNLFVFCSHATEQYTYLKPVSLVFYWVSDAQVRETIACNSTCMQIDITVISRSRGREGGGGTQRVEGQEYNGEQKSQNDTSWIYIQQKGICNKSQRAQIEKRPMRVHIAAWKIPCVPATCC
jgi:hypothetical protein